jgi:uncharacterized protein YbjT (DUF2867 family)
VTLLNRKVVLLGGSGFVGYHICKALTALGANICVFGRSFADTQTFFFEAANIRVIVGNQLDTESVISAISDADLVIQLIHSSTPGRSMSFG